MWQTDTAEARAIADRLPQSACRGVLERIVRSVPIENRAHLAPLVMRFRKIAREVPWLFAELPCDQAALTTALDAILPTGWSAPMPNWRGVSQDLPVLSALLGRGQPIGEVEVLRAFLLVALAEGAVLDRRLGKSHVEVLAQTIRAIESTTNHRYRRALFWLCETRSAAEASQLLSERLKGQKGELAEIWPSVWHPYFLRRGTAPVRRSVATPSRRRLHVRLPRQVIPPVVHPITPPQPHEPPEEYNPISSLIYVRVRARNESARAHRLTELHRSRLANHALLAQHADVIAQDEWAEILPSLLGQLQREASPNILAEICVILLIAATGREPERLITLPIHDAPPHPEPAEACLVATQEAFLWQPIPKLQDQFHPGPSLRHRFETQAVRGLTLRLPSPVSDALRRLRGVWHGHRLAELLAGQEIEGALQHRLKALADTQGNVPRLSQLRHLVACHLMERTQDLPATMMICGDSFARSDAHLYYVSFDAASLEHTYAETIWPLFKVDPGPLAASVQKPCGPAAVVRREVAVAGIRHLSQSLNRRPDVNTADLETLRRWHNRYTAYVSYYFAIITGHRPCGALYALRTSHVDWRNRYAVIQDKQVNLAYLTRPVAITPQLAMQILRYLDHLGALVAIEGMPNSARDYASRVVRGEVPMWTYLEPDGSLRGGSMADWHVHWPPAWQGLPDRWYRAYLATALRRCGGHPVYVQTQLGHFDTAGRPFSHDSPIGPRHAVEAIEPTLMQIESDLGFQLRGGWGTKDAWQPAEPPLREWSREVARHATFGRRLEVAERLLLRARTRHVRRQVEDHLPQVLQACCPPLAEAYAWLRTPGANRPEHCVAAIVDEQTVGTILDRIALVLPKETLVRAGAINVLSRLLRSCRERLRMQVPDVGMVIRGASGELAPLIEQTPVATRQMHRLRECIAQFGREAGAMPPDVRRALALVAYGGYTDPAVVFRMACGGLRRLLRPRTPSMTWLIEDHTLQRTVAVRGLASLAFREADCHGAPADDTAIQDLSRRLTRALPEELRPADADATLGMLCETAAVAARYEQSGLTRHAWDPRDGAMLAAADQLRAFLDGSDGSPAAPRSGRVSVPTVTAPRPRRVPPPRDLRREYLELCTALSNPRAILQPGSGRQAVHSRSVQRHEVLQALDILVGHADAPWTVSRTLLLHARNLLQHGTPRRAKPAIATVRTYVAEIGPRLITALGSCDVRDLSSDRLEAAYETVLEQRQWDTGAGHRVEGGAVGRNPSTSRCAQQLLAYQRWLERQGLARVDPAVFGPYLSRTAHRANRDLLSEAEYRRALAWLVAQYQSEGPSLAAAVWRRRCRLASVALILLWHTGARISEIAWLRHTDLRIRGRTLEVALRSLRERHLKTPAAKRRVLIGERMTDEEFRAVSQWLDIERAVAAEIGLGKRPLFATLADPTAAVGDAEIRADIQNAFLTACGRPMRPHLMRHTWVSRQMLEVANARYGPNEAPAVARRLQLRIHEIGHAEAGTSVTWYCHVPWAPAVSSRDPGMRRVLAWLSGKTLRSIDLLGTRRIGRRRGTAHRRLLDWAEAVYDVRAPPPRAQPAAKPPSFKAETPAGMALSLSELDRLVRELRRAKEPSKVVLRYGLSQSTWAALLAANQCLSDRCGYRLLPAVSRRGTTRLQPLPRTHSEVSGIHVFESLDVGRLEESARLFESLHKPYEARYDRFAGPALDIERLKALLDDLGLQPRPRVEDLGSGRKSLSFPGGRSHLSGFAQVAWSLALCALQVALRRAETGTATAT